MAEGLIQPAGCRSYEPVKERSLGTYKDHLAVLWVVGQLGQLCQLLAGGTPGGITQHIPRNRV